MCTSFRLNSGSLRSMAPLYHIDRTFVLLLAFPAWENVASAFSVEASVSLSPKNASELVEFRHVVEKTASNSKLMQVGSRSVL